MPNEGLAYYYTAADDSLFALSIMGDKTKALDKATQQLAKAYEAMQKANEPLLKQQEVLEKKLRDTEPGDPSVPHFALDDIQGVKNFILSNLETLSHWG